VSVGDAKGSLLHGIVRKATPTLINRPSSLSKTPMGGELNDWRYRRRGAAARPNRCSFDITGEARQQGQIDDDVAGEAGKIAVGQRKISYRREARAQIAIIGMKPSLAVRQREH
jgi:hypothetical protein